MYKAKIIDVSKIFSHADNSDMLSVEFDIIDDAETVLANRKLGFALDTSEDAIRDELHRYVDAFKNDEVIAEASASIEAANATADETIAALKDQVI